MTSPEVVPVTMAAPFDRWRATGAVLAVTAWVLCVVGIAGVDRALLPLSSFGGFIGSTVGLGLGTWWRHPDRGRPRAVGKALLVMALFAGAWISAIAAGVALDEQLAWESPTAALGIACVGFVVLYAGGVLWSVNRRAEAPRDLTLCAGTAALVPVVVMLIDGPEPVTIVLAITTSAGLGALARAVRRSMPRPSD